MENINSFLILPENQGESVQLLPNFISSNINIFNTSILRIENDKFEYFIHPNADVNQADVAQDNIESSTTEQKFDCIHCRKTITGYNEYLEHLGTHQSSKLECIKCEQVFKKQSSYFKHLLNHQEEKLFNCPVCQSGFNHEDNLKIHMTYHAKNCLVCPICTLTFQRVASLRSHVTVHQVEEMYTCWECSSEFENVDDLRRHLKIHTRELIVRTNTSVCRYCKVEFESAALLRQHILSHVEVKKLIEGRKKKYRLIKKDLKHRCTFCEKTFSKLSLLQRHIRSHTGERPFVCRVCKKRFGDKSSLNIHTLKHTGLKPFACTLCPAQFAQKCNLKVHVQKTHTAKNEGEKSFKCSKCDCIYKKVASLNAHMSKMHSNDEEISITSVINQLKNLQELSQNRTETFSNTIEKKISPRALHEDLQLSNDESANSKVYSLKQKYVGSTKIYYCSYCNKEFKKPSDLIRHLRTHTKEKPYKCHCGNSFSLKSTLLSHMRIHSQKNGKTCPKCTKIFYTTKGLTAHLRKHDTISTKNLSSDSDPNTLETENDVCSKLNVSTSEKNDCDNSSRSVQLTDSSKNPPKVRTTTTKFNCDTCGKAFRLKSRLEKHVAKHKKNDQKKIEINKNQEHIREPSDEINQVFISNDDMNVSLPALLDQNQDIQRLLVNCSDLSDNQIFTGIDPKSTLVFDSANNLSQSIILDIQSINVTSPDKLTKLLLDSTQKVSNDTRNNLSEIVEHATLELNPQNDTLSVDPSLVQNNEAVNNQNVFCVSLTNNENSENVYSMHCLTCKKFLDVNEFGTHVCLKSILRKNNIEIEHDDNVKEDELKDEPHKSKKMLKRNFECVYCKKSFTTRGAYLKHVQYHHQKEKNEDGSHKCTFCNKSFKKPSDLSRHLRTHTGEKPFACQKCDKRFTLKSTLEGHYKTHDPVATKNFVCEVCNSCFSSKASRKLHMLVHTGVKPHKCSLCNQDFRTLAHKRSHERKVHTNKKNPTKKQKKCNIKNILATAAEMIEDDNRDLEQENVQFNSIQLEFPYNNDQTIKMSESIDPVLLHQLQTSEVLLQDLDTDFLQTSVVDANVAFETNVGFQEVKNIIFECEICNKTYESKDSLGKHNIEVHLKDKLACDQLNSTGDELGEHEGFGPISCFVCDTNFNEIQQLKVHLKRIHNINDKLIVGFEEVCR